MSAKGLRDLSTGFQPRGEGGRRGARDVGGAAVATGTRDERRGVRASTSRRRCPAIAEFDAQAPGVVELVGPVIGKMQAVRALVAVGLGIAIAPLVIGIPGKVDAAVRVTEIGRIGLAPATGENGRATALFDGMASDVHTKLQPALSASEPAPSRASRACAWATAGRHDLGAVARAERQPGEVRADFANADSIPLEPIPWMFIVPVARSCRSHLCRGAAEAPVRSTRWPARRLTRWRRDSAPFRRGDTVRSHP